MSLRTIADSISEPIYYHREFANDIGEPSNANSWLDQCKRVGTVALPFFSLYKPLSLPLSLAMGGLRTFNSVSCLVDAIQKGGADEIGYACVQTLIAVVALGGTIFAHPIGMLITTGHDVVIDLARLVDALQKGEYKTSIEACLHILNNALYLALFLDGSVGYAIASLSLQILIGLYRSINEFQQGKYLEAAGAILMAVVRTNQLVGQIKMVQNQHAIEKKVAAFANKLDPEDEIDDEIDLDALDREAAALRSEIEKRHPGYSINATAYWTELTSFNGLGAHIGYYGTGFIVTLLDTNQQFISEAGMGIVAATSQWSDHWTADDMRYIEHFYPDLDLYVYTSRLVQFLVTRPLTYP